MLARKQRRVTWGVRRHLKSPSVILVAEDDDDDFYLLRTTLAKLCRRTLLCQVRGGRQALRYLEGVGIYHNRQRFPFPDLLILDLKMPVLDGIDLLAALRQIPTSTASQSSSFPARTFQMRKLSHALWAHRPIMSKAATPQRLKDVRQIYRKWLQRKSLGTASPVD